MIEDINYDTIISGHWDFLFPIMRGIPKDKLIMDCLNSNKMDNSLQAVRDINHKYIVVERRNRDEHQKGK